jgi:hypothetical protein
LVRGLALYNEHLLPPMIGASVFAAFTLCAAAVAGLLVILIRPRLAWWVPARWAPASR